MKSIVTAKKKLRMAMNMELKMKKEMKKNISTKTIFGILKEILFM